MCVSERVSVSESVSVSVSVSLSEREGWQSWQGLVRVGKGFIRLGKPW